MNTLLKKPISPLTDRPVRISFLGQMNHAYLSRPHVRRKMLKHFGERYQTKSATWILPELLESDIVHLVPLDNNSIPYRLLSSRTIFTLCPAGCGSWIYRFFNAIEWGSIPILLSDQYRLSFNDEMPYESFMLRIKGEMLLIVVTSWVPTQRNKYWICKFSSRKINGDSQPNTLIT